MKDSSFEVRNLYQVQINSDENGTDVINLEKSQIGVQPIVRGGILSEGMFAEVEPGSLRSLDGQSNKSIRNIKIPAGGSARRKFLAEWSERARHASKKGGAFSILLLPLAACGGGGTSSNPGGVSEGYVIDGYVTNAFVFRDEDGDGSYDAADGEAAAYTDSAGKYSLGGSSTASIVMDPSQDPEGRTAIDLDNPNEAFTGILKAPAGSTVVTPLTTLVQQIVETGATAEVAEAAVKTALGITGDVELTTLDPIAADNVEVYKAGVQVAALISESGGGEAGLAVSAALAKTVQNTSGAVDLTDVDVVKAVIDTAIADSPTATASLDSDSVASSAASQAAVTAAATSVDDVSKAQSATFTVTETNNVIVFGGDAIGTVVMTLNSEGGATFTRGGASGKDGTGSDASVVTIDSVADKIISGAVELTVVVSAEATSGADEFIINAPDATKIDLRGSMGEGADSIVIKVADDTAGTPDSRDLILDTSGLTVASNDRLVFDFEGEEDLVNLTLGSDVSQFSEIEVAKGTLDVRSITIKDGLQLTVNSGFSGSLDQFHSLESIVSASGLGEVTITLDSSESLSDLTGSGLDSDFVMIGTSVTVKSSTGATLLSDVAGSEVGSIPAGLASKSFMGIPQLQDSVAVLDASLQSQITSNDTDIAGNVTSLATLTSTVTALDAAYKAADTTLTTNVTDLQDSLDGITGKVTDYVAAQILILDNDLQGQITSNDTDIAGNVTSLTTLTSTVTALDAAYKAADTTLTTNVTDLQDSLDGITGKVTDYVAAQILILDNDLQGQITSNDTDIAGNVTSLTTLTSTVTALDAAYKAADTTLTTNVTDLQDSLDGITGKVTDYVAAQILILDNDLQGQITSNDTDIAGNVTSLTTLTSTVTALDAAYKAADTTLTTNVTDLQDSLDGITGKVTDYVAAQILILDNDLQGQITSNDTDIAGNVTSLTTLTSTVTALDAAYKAADTTLTTNVTDLQDSLDGITGKVTDYVAAQILILDNDLQGQITSNDTDIAGNDTDITNLTSTVDALDAAYKAADTTLTGNVTDLQTKLANITSVADSIKSVALTPSISSVGSDLNDSVLDTGEGNVTIRVALSSVAAATDVVELLLAGSSFSSAKTDTLDGTDISNGYVDFDVTQGQLGSAGTKAVSAKVTSGSVNGNESPALVFSLSATDSSAPSAPVLNDIASNDKINKFEHDGVTLLTGSAEANSKITIIFNNGSSDAPADYVRADEFGNWNLPYSSSDLPADGTYTVKVTATDAAGNVSSITSQAGVVIDSAVPSVPTISLISGDDVVDGTENGAGFTITGKGEVGATVTATLSSGRTLTSATDGLNVATVDGNGDWSIAVAANEAGLYLREGEEVVTVTQTDAAGNTSISASRVFEVGTSFTTGGDLSSTDLSSYTKVELNANTTLPTAQNKLPGRIDAKGYTITTNGDISIASITVTNYGDLTVSGSTTLTAAASQVSQFNAAGTVTATGILAVTAGGDLSSLNLSNATVTLSSAATDINASGVPKAIDQASTHGITLGSNTSIANTTITNPSALTLGDNVTATMTQAQHEAFSAINATGSGEQITLTTAGVVTAASGVETYVLAAAGGSTITLGANAQSVTTGADGADTITVGTRTATGTFNTVAADIISLGDGADIKGVNGEGAGAGKALDADNLTLASGASVTMTLLQHDGFSGTVTAAGTEQITLSTAGTVTAKADIETYVLAAAGGSTITLGANAQSVTTGADGADTITVGTRTATGTFNTVAADIISLGDGADIKGVNGEGAGAGKALDADNLTLASGASVTMTALQHDSFSGTVIAAGTEQITLSTAGTVTAKADIETYVLAAAGGSTITLGANAQNVTTGADGADTITVGTRTATGTFNTVAADIISLGDGADIKGVNGEGNGAGTALDANNLTLASGASVTMTQLQHQSFSGTVTAAGTEQITLSTAGTVTAASAVETYVLAAAGGSTITLGANAQNVTTGADGADTITVGTRTATGTFNTVAADIISLGDGADIKGVNGEGAGAGKALDADNLTLASGASVTMTLLQHDGFSGTVTAAGTEQITLSTAGTVTAKADIETYVLAAAGGSTITLGANAQSVTTGADGADTITVGTRTATGTFNTVAADIISLGDGADIKGVNGEGAGAGKALDADNLTLASGASVTMTALQHDSFSGTVIAAGTEQITLSTAGTVTAASAVETYVLAAAGGSNITLGANAQNVTTGADGADTITVGTRTATGTFNTVAADIISLGDGADIKGVNGEGAGAGKALDADNLTLASGASVTMTLLQHDGFSGTVTAAGTEQITLSTAGTVTAKADIETYVLAAAGGSTITLGANAQSVTTGADGADTITVGTRTATGTFNTVAADIISLGDGADIKGVNGEGAGAGKALDADNLTLASGASVTMTALQHDSFSGTVIAAGTEQITLSTAGTVTAASAVETYVLAAAGGSNITLGANAQNVTTGADGADTITVGTRTATGTFNTVAADIISLGDGADIKGVNGEGNGAGTALDANNLTLASGASVTMTQLQHQSFSGTVTAAGTEQITLSTAGTVTAASAVETYVLAAAGGSTITLGANAQNVTTGADGADTITVGTRTATGTFNTVAADIISLGDGADIKGVNGEGAGAGKALDADNLTLASGASVTMTLLQHDGFSGTVTAAGTEQITLSTAGTVTAKADIETYVLAAAGGSTITLGANAQSVTTGADGADTITVGTRTATGTFNTVAADIISLGDGADIKGVNGEGAGAGKALDADNLTLASGASVTMTALQHDGFSGTVIAAGTEQITLSTAGTVTAASAVETYVLAAAGGSNITLGANAQNVTTGADGADTITVGTRTATGTFNTVAADIISLGDGADIKGVNGEGNGAGTALDANNLTLASGASVTMTQLQHQSFSGTVTAAGTEQITLSTAGTVTAASAVETYVLAAAGGSTITLGANAQNVTTGADGADTITVGTRTATGTFNTVAADIISLGDGADIKGVNGEGAGAGTALDADNLTLASGASVTMTQLQHQSFSGTVTAAGTEQITLSTAGTVNADSAVETYVLADGANTFNMGANHTSVTGGSGDDIISTNSQATISGTISGGSGGNDTLRINGADVAFTGATFTNIDTIDFNTGTRAATFDQADISGMTVTETGNEGTVKISSTSGSTTKFDVAGTTTLDLSNIASGVNIVFLDEDGPASTTDVNLLTGSTLTINAADLTGLTVTEGGSATVNVKDLASSTSLAGVTATNVTGHVAVSGSTSLSGDVNGATIVVDSAASTPILDLTGATNVSGRLNLNSQSLQVNVTSAQHDALTFENVAGTLTARVSNATGSTDTIDQETGIESYSLVSNASGDTITMNLLGSDAGVNITGNSTAALTLAAGNSNTFTGTWSSFAAGDTLAVSGSTLSVDVTGVSSGTSLGGINTITVANGDTLTAFAAQLNAATATGAGATTIKSLNSSTASLANVNTDTVTLDVTGGAATVGSGFALKAAKAYAVTGGSSRDLDLSTASSLGLDGSSSFAIAASTSLTATAAQMNTVATSGSGTTFVDTLNSSTADLSELNSTAVTLNVSGTEIVGSNFTLAGRAYTVAGSSATLDLSAATLSTSANYTINSGNTAKFAAADLNGATAGGAGSVYITDLDATTGADLDAVTSSGGVEIALDANATLTSSATIGASNLTISADGSARILDLSSVTTSNFNLSNKTLAVGSNVTLKMTADQAAIPTSFSGAGSVTITSGTIDASLANSIAGGISGTLVISDLSQVNGKASDLVTMITESSITKPSEFSSVISAEAGSAVTTASNINTINTNNSNGSISFASGITVQDTAANLGNIVGDATISFANNVSIKATNDVGPVLADAIHNTINGSGSKVYDVAMGVSDINNAVQASLAAATTVTVSGSSGLDTINMSTFTLSNLTINSGAFGDVIYASLGADTIDSGTGSDNIYSFGANNITTGSGNDSINYMSSSDFGDTVTDFSSTDKIDYDNSEGALSYLAINGATGVAFESVSANSTIADGTTVVELTGATNSAGDAAGLVTALGSSATNSSLATGDTLVIVSYGSSKAHVFEFTDANNGNIEAGELSLIATLNNVDADVLTADNFI